MMFTNEIIGILAIVVGVISEASYLRSIFKGGTKPHLFTWLIWSILCTIGYFAQLTDNAGPGAWALGFTALLSWLNTGLSFRYGEKEITRTDKLALAASLIAIILWLFTDDPLWSVILISAIDVVGFYPTIRKSWRKPFEENLTAYYFANLKLGLSLFALNSITIVTALYPLTIVVTNSLFLLMCHIRRRCTPAV